MSTGTTIIDAAVRFARSNPELVDCAREGALRTGRSVDELLREAIARMRAAMDEDEPGDQALAYRSSSVAASRRTESSAYS
jgi:hypothetical protein